MNTKRAMLEAVANLEWTGDFFPIDEYYGGAFAILVSALGKLTDDELETALANIEGGHLRQEVERYRARLAARARSSPYPRVGNGHAA